MDTNIRSKPVAGWNPIPELIHTIEISNKL